MSFEAALVVMAAGMGSRFGGLKQIEPISEKGGAILDFSVYDAIEAGFTEVVFIIKHAIEEDFKKNVGDRISKKIKVKYVFQETDNLPDGFNCPEGRVKPWGTGHAVLCCKDVVKVPFAVINADDYYGKTAFRQIYNYLKEKNDYCMVGFRLMNTITENGFVSRGVCKTENGKLVDVKEYTKIDSNCNYLLPDETKGTLASDTVVSMNMWGFTTDIFEYLEKGFCDFLKEHGNELKSEYYLPALVDALIKNGEKQVEALVAEDKWYGVTYKEDMQEVVTALRNMEKAGMYKNLV